jgi:hypothetical protein
VRRDHRYDQRWGAWITGNLANHQAVVSDRSAMALVMSVYAGRSPRLDGEAGSHFRRLSLGSNVRMAGVQARTLR